MSTDLLSLLHRDHRDLRLELTRLLDPLATIAELRASLDGVRLGLVAHAEAEDIVLGRFEEVPALRDLIAQDRAAHRTQEHTLSALVSARPGTPSWRQHAGRLRELVDLHARDEEERLIPTLRRQIAEQEYAALAGAFATERLRQLAMLQPSAPVFAPFVLEQRAS